MALRDTYEHIIASFREWVLQDPVTSEGSVPAVVADLMAVLEEEGKLMVGGREGDLFSRSLLILPWEEDPDDETHCGHFGDWKRHRPKGDPDGT